MKIAYDFSSSPIAPAALLADGVTEVMRYVSTRGNGKNITQPEYDAYVRNGIEVGLVYETTADWMLGGYSAGLAAARSARAQAPVGYPADRPIWYADDFADAPAQIPVVLDCLHGCSDAEGSKALVRLYADFDAVEAAFAAGYTGPWQTVAWSNGRRSQHAVLYQTGQTAICGGVEVDINELTGPLFPAAPIVAAATSMEDEDMSTTSSNGRAGLAWAGGTKHIIEANYAAAGQPDLVLGVELKLISGPVYAPDFTVSHATGTGTYRIPDQFIPVCRGVILTAKSPASVVYDVYAA